MYFVKKIISIFLLLFPVATQATVHQKALSAIESLGKNCFFNDHTPYYIGVLGEKWTFPSDHLPIGLTVGDFHIALWNVLKKDYLFHIEKNTQGLKESSILKDNMPLPGQKNLTIREFIILQNILEMSQHHTHPRSLIALQEMHPDMISYLKNYLPPEWRIAQPFDESESEDIFLYDSNVFRFIDSEAVFYEMGRPKTIFTLTLQNKSSGKIYRFVQSHVPGGPSSERGCQKFAYESLRQYDPNITTILMGDMNQPPYVIEKTFAKAAREVGMSENCFEYASLVYPTHVNTLLEATWIDHFFISEGEVYKISQDPKELFSSLENIVLLLQKKD